MAAVRQEEQPDQFERLERVVMLGRTLKGFQELLAQYDAISARRRAVLVRQIEEAKAEFDAASAVHYGTAASAHA